MVRKQRNSLSHEALGHNAELPASVLNQVPILGHHHVVELLPLLCNHHIGIPLHSQFETYQQKRKTSQIQVDLSPLPSMKCENSDKLLFFYSSEPTIEDVKVEINEQTKSQLCTITLSQCRKIHHNNYKTNFILLSTAIYTYQSPKAKVVMVL